MALELESLTGQVIGAAIEVHRALGPGFVEAIYEQALRVELGHRGVPYDTQLALPIFYRDVEVGLHRLDLLVAGQLVVELKAVRALAPEHFVMVRSYLRAARCEHGLLLNFSRPTLEMKRVRVKDSEV